MKEARKVVVNHGTISHASTSTSTSNKKIDPVNKTTVIAIAVVATVLILALIVIGIFFFLRRRSRKIKARRHDNLDARDRSIGNPIDSTSKTPLMREDNQSHTEHRASPMPRYDEENDVDLSAPPTHRRSFSGVSMRSLPPSYSAAIHAVDEGAGESSTHSRHKRDSTIDSSDGLRPLMLVAAQNGEDVEQSIAEHRGRNQRPWSPDRSALIPAPLAGRPRASSRFREEDLDV